MKVSELKARKIELGYTNEMVSELSGVPLSTVQKIFGGTTAAPRYETLKQIEKALFPNIASNENGSKHINYEDMIRSSSTNEPLCIREKSAIEYYGYNNIAYAGKRQGEYTVDDWMELPEGARMELIDGCLYDLASPSTIHQYLIGQIFRQIDNALFEKGNDHCMPFVSPLGVQLFKDDKNMLIPDLIVVCNKDKIKKNIVVGAPDLVIEVLSPSTGGYDRLLKLNRYWESGVREYWIIDPKRDEVIVYCFETGTPPRTYKFTDCVPVTITGGEVNVDFRPISERMHRYFEK